MTGRTPNHRRSAGEEPAAGALHPSGAGWKHFNEVLAPFVAWLAAQGLDEVTRRSHREALERYLRWSYLDTGPARDRRRRYERHLCERSSEHLGDARAALDRWAEHRRILADTLPVDR